MAKTRKNLNRTKSKSTRSKTRSKMGGKTRSKMGGKTRSKMGGKTRSKMGGKTRSKMGGKTRSKMGGKTRSKMGGKTRSKTRSKKMRGGKRSKKYHKSVRKHRKRYLKRKSMRGGNCGCNGNCNNTSQQGGAMPAYKIPMYKYNSNPFLPALNTPCLKAPTPYKGGKRAQKRKGKKIKQRGGGMSSMFSNMLPGYTDVRDLYWKGGESIKGLYNQYNGNNWGPNTSPGVQPLRKTAMAGQTPLDLPKMIRDSSDDAATYSVK